MGGEACLHEDEGVEDHRVGAGQVIVAVNLMLLETLRDRRMNSAQPEEEGALHSVCSGGGALTTRWASWRDSS